MKEQGVDEFLATTLTVLENINLDPVFDYSQADEAAQKITMKLLIAKMWTKNFQISYLKINYM